MNIIGGTALNVITAPAGVSSVVDFLVTAGASVTLNMPGANAAWSWSNGTSTIAGTTDASGFVLLRDFTVPINSTVTFTATTNQNGSIGNGQFPVRIRCFGNCNIQGKVLLNGKQGNVYALSTAANYANPNNPVFSISPAYDAPGAFGGGTPAPFNVATSTLTDGDPGRGPGFVAITTQGAGGGGGGKYGGGNTTGVAYSSYYFNLMPGGGGGGVNLQSSAKAAPGLKSAWINNYLKPGNGGAVGTLTPSANPAVDYGNPDVVDFVSGASSPGLFGGNGGGAGGSARGSSSGTPYWGPGGQGGGGGGAIGFEVKGTFTLGDSALIQARGGTGGSGTNYYWAN